MNPKLRGKTRESLSAVLPITGIMRAIGEHCGMHSEAKGLVTSLPIDSVMGL